MEGTIFEFESGVVFVTLMFTCAVLFCLTVIYFIFWKKEIKERKEREKALLRGLICSFSTEIAVAVDKIIVSMKNVLTEFERGEYSKSMEWLIKNVKDFRSKKEFLPAIALLRGNVHDLLRKVDKITIIEDKKVIVSLIEEIHELIGEIKSFVNEYKIESSFDVESQLQIRDKGIEQLRNSINKLEKYILKFNLKE